MIKLVIFDFDETLTPRGIDGNRFIARELGIEKDFDKVCDKYKKKQIKWPQVMLEIEKLFLGLSLQTIQKLRSKLILRPKAVETFRELKKRGIKTAIITGEGVDIMKNIIELLKPDFLDAIKWKFENQNMTGEFEDAGESKKEKAHRVMKLFEATPKETLIVGDGWGDLDMIPKGGKFVAIKGQMDLSKVADYTITEIPEILKIIDSIK